MASLNKVLLIGRLGRDPEVKYLQSGQPVVSMSLATDESYMGKDGQKVNKTEWHKIVVWGKQADFCGKHLSKGRLVAVEGKLETHKYQNKNGEDSYTTRINAMRVQSLEPKQGDSFNNDNTSDISAMGALDNAPF